MFDDWRVAISTAVSEVERALQCAPDGVQLGMILAPGGLPNGWRKGWQWFSWLFEIWPVVKWWSCFLLMVLGMLGWISMFWGDKDMVTVSRKWPLMLHWLYRWSMQHSVYHLNLPHNNMCLTQWGMFVVTFSGKDGDFRSPFALFLGLFFDKLHLPSNTLKQSLLVYPAFLRWQSLQTGEIVPLDPVYWASNLFRDFSFATEGILIPPSIEIYMGHYKDLYGLDVKPMAVDHGWRRAWNLAPMWVRVSGSSCCEWMLGLGSHFFGCFVKT